MPSSIRSPQHRVLTGLLRDIREEAGLTQGGLAQRLGHDQTYVSKFEVGERRLDLVQLRAVCEALGTDLPTLVMRFEKLLSER